MHPRWLDRHSWLGAQGKRERGRERERTEGTCQTWIALLVCHTEHGFMFFNSEQMTQNPILQKRGSLRCIQSNVRPRKEQRLKCAQRVYGQAKTLKPFVFILCPSLMLFFDKVCIAFVFYVGTESVARGLRYFCHNFPKENT